MVTLSQPDPRINMLLTVLASTDFNAPNGGTCTCNKSEPKPHCTSGPVESTSSKACRHPVSLKPLEALPAPFYAPPPFFADLVGFFFIDGTVRRVIFGNDMIPQWHLRSFRTSVPNVLMILGIYSSRCFICSEVFEFVRSRPRQPLYLLPQKLVTIPGDSDHG